MLKRVEPLRNELQGLEDLAGENKMKATEVNKLIYNNKTNNNHRQINQLLLKYLLFLGRFA
jgi:hypothetical protein